MTGPAAHLWTRTDLRPADIDLAQLYDGFSFNCLSWLEALGFCGEGEAKDFLDGGKNIALDGMLPLNTHGGQLSSGRLHGFGFIHEAITQLRGDAGERQVAERRDRGREQRRRRARGVFLFTAARSNEGSGGPHSQPTVRSARRATASWTRRRPCSRNAATSNARRPEARRMVIDIVRR